MRARLALATPTSTIAHATMREAKKSSLEMTLYRVAKCMATSYSHHAPRSSSRPCSDVSFGSRSWMDRGRPTQQKGSRGLTDSPGRSMYPGYTHALYAYL